MRSLLAAILAGVVVSTAAAQAPPPNDGGPLPVISAPSIVSRIEGRLTVAAGKIAGTPAEVRCWSRTDWNRLAQEWQAYVSFNLADKIGYADPKNGRVHLSPRACAALAPFLYRGARPKLGTNGRQELAHALVTLAHEAQHVASIIDEARAECVGQQRVRPLARMLGASRDYAAGLAVFAWRVLYVPLPASYKSPGCRNGGPLDLNPLTSAWP